MEGWQFLLSFIAFIWAINKIVAAVLLLGTSYFEIKAKEVEYRLKKKQVSRVYSTNDDAYSSLYGGEGGNS